MVEPWIDEDLNKQTNTRDSPVAPNLLSWIEGVNSTAG